MDDAELGLLRDLLTRQRLLALAVAVGPEPIIGLVPFLAAPDLGSLVVHVSGLARHTRGLGEGAPFSAVIHVPDAPDVDALRVPRVVVQGHSRQVEDEEVLAAIRQAWVRRYPSAAATVGLGDFAFYSLDLEGGRLIGGFGQARNLSTDHFAQAAALRGEAG